MNKLNVLFLVLILTNCKTTDQLTDVRNTENIFRYAHINVNDSLIIGQSLVPLLVYGTLLTEKSHRIPINYPGTESITSYFDNDSTITDLVFTYQPTFDFNESLYSYTNDFGSPITFLHEGLIIHRWNDGLTKFDLVKTSSAEDTLFYSILSDIDSSQITEKEYSALRNLRVSPNMHDILSTTEIWSFIGSLNSDISSSINSKNPEVLTKSLDSLINKHFNSRLLYSYALEYMNEYFDNESIVELNSWLFSDSQIRQSYTLKKFTPELTIEEYAQKIQNSPPPQERIFTVYQFVQANKAGEFFVKIEQAQELLETQITSSVLKTKSTFSPFSIEEKNKLSERYSLGVLVSFLWVMEPLTNEQIRKTTEHYLSDSGRLYVDTYSDAIEYIFARAGETLLKDLETF